MMEMKDGQAVPRGFDKANEQKMFDRIHMSLLSDITFKKWCVEKALEAQSSEPVETTARKIFEFIMAKEQPPVIAEANLPYDPRN